MFPRFAHTLMLVVALASMAGCAAGPASTTTESLYQRLGGQPAIEHVAGALVDRSSADPRTARTFEGVNLGRLKQKIAEQLCAATGGPCRYTGDTMKASHAGLGISESEFNAMVEHLLEILHAANVDAREQDELIALLAPMKRDIVETRRMGSSK